MIVLNRRSVIMILISVVLHGMETANTHNNHMETFSKTGIKISQLERNDIVTKSVNSSCPTGLDHLECNQLPLKCISCNYKFSCTYGKEINITCNTKPGVNCIGPKEFSKSMICQYCWQTEGWNHQCARKEQCIANQKQFYTTNCSVPEDLMCLGNRVFQKRVRCNFTLGYKWSTALWLSVTLGGFGADRFYLGHWQEGIGKLFSFGGLGVWTLIDVILVSIRYLGPSEGSLFV